MDFFMELTPQSLLTQKNSVCSIKQFSNLPHNWGTGDLSDLAAIFLNLQARDICLERTFVTEKLHPYVVFLPKTEKKDKILSAIFGSKAGVDILRYSLKQGVARNIYQK